MRERVYNSLLYSALLVHPLFSLFILFTASLFSLLPFVFLHMLHQGRLWCRR